MLNRYALFLVVFVAFSLVILYIFKVTRCVSFTFTPSIWHQSLLTKKRKFQEQSGDYYDYVEVVFNIYYAGGVSGLILVADLRSIP